MYKKGTTTGTKPKGVRSKLLSDYAEGLQAMGSLERDELDCSSSSDDSNKSYEKRKFQAQKEQRRLVKVHAKLQQDTFDARNTINAEVAALDPSLAPMLPKDRPTSCKSNTHHHATPKSLPIQPTQRPGSSRPGTGASRASAFSAMVQPTRVSLRHHHPHSAGSNQSRQVSSGPNTSPPAMCGLEPPIVANTTRKTGNKGLAEDRRKEAIDAEISMWQQTAMNDKSKFGSLLTWGLSCMHQAYSSMDTDRMHYAQGSSSTTRKPSPSSSAPTSEMATPVSDPVQLSGITPIRSIDIDHLEAEESSEEETSIQEDPLEDTHGPSSARLPGRRVRSVRFGDDNDDVDEDSKRKKKERKRRTSLELASRKNLTGKLQSVQSLRYKQMKANYKHLSNSRRSSQLLGQSDSEVFESDRSVGGAEEAKGVGEDPTRLVTVTACFVLDHVMCSLPTHARLWTHLRNEVFGAIFDGYQKDKLPDDSEPVGGCTPVPQEVLKSLTTVSDQLAETRHRLDVATKESLLRTEAVKVLAEIQDRSNKVRDLELVYTTFLEWRTNAARQKAMRHNAQQLGARPRKRMTLFKYFGRWARMSTVHQLRKLHRTHQEMSSTYELLRKDLNRSIKEATEQSAQQLSEAQTALKEEQDLRERQFTSNTIEIVQLSSQVSKLESNLTVAQVEVANWTELWHQTLKPMPPSVPVILVDDGKDIQSALLPLMTPNMVLDVPQPGGASEGQASSSQVKSSSDQKSSPPESEGTGMAKPILQVEGPEGGPVASATSGSSASKTSATWTTARKRGASGFVNEEPKVSRTALIHLKETVERFLVNWVNFQLNMVSYDRTLLTPQEDLADGEIYLALCYSIIQTRKHAMSRGESQDTGPVNLAPYSSAGPTLLQAAREMFGHLLNLSEEHSWFPFLQPLLTFCPYAKDYCSEGKVLFADRDAWCFWILAHLFVLNAAAELSHQLHGMADTEMTGFTQTLPSQRPALFRAVSMVTFREAQQSDAQKSRRKSVRAGTYRNGHRTSTSHLSSDEDSRQGAANKSGRRATLSSSLRRQSSLSPPKPMDPAKLTGSMSMGNSTNSQSARAANPPSSTSRGSKKAKSKSLIIGMNNAPPSATTPRLASSARTGTESQSKPQVLVLPKSAKRKGGKVSKPGSTTGTPLTKATLEPTVPSAMKTGIPKLRRTASGRTLPDVDGGDGGSGEPTTTGPKIRRSVGFSTSNISNSSAIVTPGLEDPDAVSGWSNSAPPGHSPQIAFGSSFGPTTPLAASSSPLGIVLPAFGFSQGPEGTPTSEGALSNSGMSLSRNSQPFNDAWTPTQGGLMHESGNGGEFSLSLERGSKIIHEVAKREDSTFILPVVEAGDRPPSKKDANPKYQPQNSRRRSASDHRTTGGSVGGKDGSRSHREEEDQDEEVVPEEEAFGDRLVDPSKFVSPEVAVTAFNEQLSRQGKWMALVRLIYVAVVEYKCLDLVVQLDDHNMQNRGDGGAGLGVTSPESGSASGSPGILSTFLPIPVSSNPASPVGSTPALGSTPGLVPSPLSGSGLGAPNDGSFAESGNSSTGSTHLTPRASAQYLTV